MSLVFLFSCFNFFKKGRKKFRFATKKFKNGLEEEELKAYDSSRTLLECTNSDKEVENIPYIDEEVAATEELQRNKTSNNEPGVQKVIVKRIAGTSAVEISVKRDTKDTHCHVMIQTSERCEYLYEFLGMSLDEEIMNAEKRAKAKANAVRSRTE